MFNESTVRSMTIDELERNSHMLGNISNEILLDIFLEKFRYDFTDEIADELAQAQDDLGHAERELDIANSKIQDLEDEIASLKRV